MRETTINILLDDLLPETAYEVSNNGWYYYECLGFYKTEEEALASVNMTKESYLKQREEYTKWHTDYSTVIHIDLINPKRYIQEYYKELTEETKNRTLENEATRIKEEAKEKIDYAIRIKTRNQIEEFLKYMLNYADKEYGARPD